MADQTEFILQMPDGENIKNVEELREHFDLISVPECYSNGKCTVLQVPFSLEEAVKCFQEVSERGNAEAQYRPGCFYMFGDGVEENEEKGVMLIHKAAGQGHIEAQYELGIDDTKGYDVEIDEEAAKWFKKAAEQGYTETQYVLGVNYSAGPGAGLNGKEAGKWLQKAAEEGHIEAEYWLGGCVDGMETVKHFQASAQQGHAGAQYHLAICYMNGEGVETDKKEALKWLWKSAEQGYPDAEEALEHMEQRGR